VVASPVGVTTEMVRDGETGFLARTADEWEARLEALLDDAALRRRLGEAGRAQAEARWSLLAQAPRFVELMSRAVQA
jgi:glycosyltransferase involved in cell wall biosynthesis